MDDDTLPSRGIPTHQPPTPFNKVFVVDEDEVPGSNSCGVSSRAGTSVSLAATAEVECSGLCEGPICVGLKHSLAALRGSPSTGLRSAIDGGVCHGCDGTRSIGREESLRSCNGGC